ncbi:exported hypothetical protein [Parafrankia sp. Ea1.12]|nr:exported hypothetical protein [Parafrankia sp. Ea1.12]
MPRPRMHSVASTPCSRTLACSPPPRSCTPPAPRAVARDGAHQRLRHRSRRPRHPAHPRVLPGTPGPHRIGRRPRHRCGTHGSIGTMADPAPLTDDDLAEVPGQYGCGDAIVLGVNHVPGRVDICRACAPPPGVTEGEGRSRRGLHFPARQYLLTSIGARRDFHESRLPHPAALHSVTGPRVPWGRSRTPVNPIRRTSFDVWHHRATLPPGRNKGAKQKIHNYRTNVVPFTFPHCAEEP